MKKKRTLIILFCLCICIILIILIRKEASYRKARISAKIKANQLIKKRVDQTKTNGSYIVGQDIPEGEYVVVILDLKNQKTSSGNYTIYQEASKKNLLKFSNINVNKTELLKNKLLSKLHIKNADLDEYASDLISLENNQFIELTNIKMYPAEVRKKPNSSKLIDGTYKVGRDIPEGTYSVKTYDSAKNKFYKLCIYANIKQYNNEKETIIAKYQESANQSYPEKITIEDGQYVSFDNLIIKRKD